MQVRMASHFRKLLLGLLSIIAKGLRLGFGQVSLARVRVQRSCIERVPEHRNTGLEPGRLVVGSFLGCYIAQVELMLSMRGTNPATVKDCKEQCLGRFGVAEGLAGRKPGSCARELAGMQCFGIHTSFAGIQAYMFVVRATMHHKKVRTTPLDLRS